MSERVLDRAVYSLIKELEVQTGRRVKGEARCKCECKRGARCECGVKCERGVKCEHECEARAQSEIRKMGCSLFILFFLSVCTGDISMKAMVGVDIAA